VISNTYRSQSLDINEKKDKLTGTSYIYKAALANGYIRNVTLVKKQFPLLLQTTRPQMSLSH
jgi:hypothetical protein